MELYLQNNVTYYKLIEVSINFKEEGKKDAKKEVEELKKTLKEDVLKIDMTPLPDKRDTFSFMDNLTDSAPSIWNAIDRIDIEYFKLFIIHRIMETQRGEGRMVPESSTRQSRFIVK